MYVQKEKIFLEYDSKYNSNREKQVIHLMIPNGEALEAKSEGQWNFLAVKKLPALLKGIASKFNGDFDCLNCL